MANLEGNRNMKRYAFIGIVALLGGMACQEAIPTGPAPPPKENRWLISKDFLFDGGTGQDGIPALDSPQFVSAETADYLNDEDLVLGYINGDDIRAYPHRILDYHEIVNDLSGNDAFAITYCPLTGSGIGWSREVDGITTTFGVSGFLYDTNLMPYDRATGSNWSQLRGDCVNGPQIGTRAAPFSLIETTWATWRNFFPDTKALSLETGFDRAGYEAYPYLDYRTNDEFFLVPVDTIDPRIPAKERVHGIIVNGQAKVYRFEDFGNERALIHDFVQGKEVVIIGDQAANLIVSFQRRLADGTRLTFSAVANGYPILMQDETGNHWNLAGKAVSGPRMGEQLIPTQSYMAYAFAFGSFFTGYER